MELGKIKARIREKECAPSIPLVVPGSNKVLWVKVQKSALMEELDKVFPTKVSETGLMFDGDKLMPVKAATVPEVTLITPKPNTIQTSNGFTIELEDDDDLLADDDRPSDDDDLLA